MSVFPARPLVPWQKKEWNHNSLSRSRHEFERHLSLDVPNESYQLSSAPEYPSTTTCSCQVYRNTVRMSISMKIAFSSPVFVVKRNILLCHHSEFLSLADRSPNHFPGQGTHSVQKQVFRQLVGQTCTFFHKKCWAVVDHDQPLWSRPGHTKAVFGADERCSNEFFKVKWSRLSLGISTALTSSTPLPLPFHAAATLGSHDHKCGSVRDCTPNTSQRASQLPSPLLSGPTVRTALPPSWSLSHVPPFWVVDNPYAPCPPFLHCCLLSLWSPAKRSNTEGESRSHESGIHNQKQSVRTTDTWHISCKGMAAKILVRPEKQTVMCTKQTLSCTST